MRGVFTRRWRAGSWAFLLLMLAAAARQRRSRQVHVRCELRMRPDRGLPAATTNTDHLSAGDRQPSMTFLDEGGQAMTEDSLGTWLDAMPVDDVRLRIEQIEQELSDLRALERLHEGRQPSAPEPSSGLGSQPT